MEPMDISSDGDPDLVAHDLVKAKLGELRNTRAELDTMLAEVQQRTVKMVDLCNHFLSTVDVVNQHSTILSPIRRAPVEVLHSIFEFAVESADELPLSADSIAVRITHVSTEWRNIALGAKSLWSSFRIVPPTYTFPHASYWAGDGRTVDFNPLNSPQHQEYERRLNAILDRVKIWVTRSRNRPLDFEFDATRMIEGFGSCLEDGDFDNDEISRGLEKNVFAPARFLIDYLVQHSSRWSNVTLTLPMVSKVTVFQKLLEVPAVKAPLLEHFDLTLDYDFFSSHERPQYQPYDVKFAHSLLAPSKSHSLNLIIHPEVEIGSEVPINWARLTDITFSTRRHNYQTIGPQGLEAMEWSAMCLFLLSSCHNLEHCVLLMPRLWPSSEAFRLSALNSPLATKKYTLPKLRSFMIRHISEVPLGFAKCLELPALEELTMKCEYQDPEPKKADESSILEFVRRFGSRLTEVTIHYVDLKQEGLYECLENLPNVRTLRLTGERGCSLAQHAELNAEVLQRMNRDEVLCPNLENLFLRLGPSDDLTNDALVDFIVARRPAASSSTDQPLRSLKIKLHEMLGARPSLREDLALEREEIGDLDGFVLTEEYVPRRRLPSWEIKTVDPDLDF